MKKNSLLILFYLLLLGYLAFIEFEKPSINNSFSFSNNEFNLEKNSTTLSMWTKKYNDKNSTINRIWAIQEVKKKPKKVEKKVEKKITLVEVTQDTKNKTICIAKKCFKLVGIFSDAQGRYGASLYNAKTKPSLKNFYRKDKVDLTIMIKKIMHDSIVFKDLNSTREWSIKLFDINSSKYKPKDFE